VKRSSFEFLNSLQFSSLLLQFKKLPCKSLEEICNVAKGMVENAGMGTGYGYRVAGTFCTFSVFCQIISRLKDPGEIRYGFLLLKWPNNLSSFKDSFKVCIIRIKQFNLKYAYFRYL
jgi:hypothetical protein